MKQQDYIISEEEIERIKSSLADARIWQLPEGKHTKEEILKFIIGIAEKMEGEQ